MFYLKCSTWNVGEQCEYPVPHKLSFQENTLVPHYLIRLFYVEHMQNLTKLLFFTLFSLVLIGCNKRDPNPENKDPVYAQLQTDLGAAKAGLALVTDSVNSSKADLEKAVPQSGEYAVFQKRVNDALGAQVYAAQQVRMYEVRIEERRLYVERRYLESLTPNGRKWPEEGEAEAELQKLQLFREKTARVKDTLKKDEPKDVPRGTTEGKPAEGKSSTGEAGEKPATSSK